MSEDDPFRNVCKTRGTATSVFSVPQRSFVKHNPPPGVGFGSGCPRIIEDKSPATRNVPRHVRPPRQVNSRIDASSVAQHKTTAKTAVNVPSTNGSPVAPVQHDVSETRNPGTRGLRASRRIAVANQMHEERQRQSALTHSQRAREQALRNGRQSRGSSQLDGTAAAVHRPVKKNARGKFSALRHPQNAMNMPVLIHTKALQPFKVEIHHGLQSLRESAKRNRAVVELNRMSSESKRVISAAIMRQSSRTTNLFNSPQAKPNPASTEKKLTVNHQTKVVAFGTNVQQSVVAKAIQPKNPTSKATYERKPIDVVDTMGQKTSSNPTRCAASPSSDIPKAAQSFKLMHPNGKGQPKTGSPSQTAAQSKPIEKKSMIKVSHPAAKGTNPLRRSNDAKPVERTVKTTTAAQPKRVSNEKQLSKPVVLQQKEKSTKSDRKPNTAFGSKIPEPVKSNHDGTHHSSCKKETSSNQSGVSESDKSTHEKSHHKATTKETLHRKSGRTLLENSVRPKSHHKSPRKEAPSGKLAREESRHKDSKRVSLHGNGIRFSGRASDVHSKLRVSGRAGGNLTSQIGPILPSGGIDHVPLKHFNRPAGQRGRKPPTKGLKANQERLVASRDALDSSTSAQGMIQSLQQTSDHFLHELEKRVVVKSVSRPAKEAGDKKQAAPVVRKDNPPSSEGVVQQNRVKLVLELNTPRRALLVVRRMNNKMMSVFVRRARISPDSICSSYAYILDDVPTKELVLFIGSKASKHVVMFATKLVEDIRLKERQSRPKIIRIDERRNDGTRHGNDSKSEEASAFWKALGGNGDEKPRDDVPEELASTLDPLNVLYRCEMPDDGTEAKLIKQEKVLRSCINEDGCYVLDTYTEVFVWIGNKTSLTTRRKLYTSAAYLGMNARPRPLWVTDVDLIQQGYESELFKIKLPDWNQPEMKAFQQKIGIAVGGEVERDAADAHFDAHCMLAPPSRALLYKRLEGEENTNPNGCVKELFRVKDEGKVAIQREYWGHFWDGESYIILYQYRVRNTFFYVTYFWQGRRCRIVDQGKAAALTRDVAVEREIDSVQIRVPEGKETPHFLQIFGGLIVIHNGKHPSTSYSPSPSPSLYRASCGLNPETFIVLQVQCEECQLNSNTCFVLESNDSKSRGRLTIWHGLHNSCTISCERVHSVFAQLYGGPDALALAPPVTENKDDKAFCAALSGHGEFGRICEQCLEPRLWCCHCCVGSGNGVFTTDGVALFSVEDLNESHTAILDTGCGVVYVWIGSRSSWPERMCAVRAAIAYCSLENKVSKHRACVLSSGEEESEPLFIHAFGGAWDRGKKMSPKKGVCIPAEIFLGQILRKYTVDDLRKSSNPIRFIDGAHLERYLADSDFNQVFGMSRSSFNRLPAYRRAKIKRDAELY